MALVTSAHRTLAEARAVLRSRGMAKSHADVIQKREYWKFEDRTNVVSDHSATITRLNRSWYAVSDFSH